jgi:polyhydroxyalkanoate synthase
MTQRASRRGNPDRRLAPRPFPAHLASAMMLWQSSRAALPILKNVLPPSSGVGAQLRALLAEIDAVGADKVAAALDREIAGRAQTYLAGLEAYRRHPFRRRATATPVLWREGTTRLLDYGRGGPDRGVLIVPSLINRYHVLDILPQLSFLRHLAGTGLRPLVVDWGAPGKRESAFDLTNYVTGRLDGAFTAAARAVDGPIGILGYCMGGLLALALALRRQSEIGCLVLLATPWDFHAGNPAQARRFAEAAEQLISSCGSQPAVPVEIVQSLFLMLDPFTAERKFTRFAAHDAASDEAHRFVALEDWLNDGVPLATRVARECMGCWYADNEPGQGRWHVGRQCVEPKQLRQPALVVLPSRDRIVPPNSAEPLATALGATVLRPPLGHIGMMSATRAPEIVWNPIAKWLRTQLSAR